MQYLSTRDNEIKESFLKTLYQGLSKEGGLFLPVEWPLISINDLKGKTYQEIAHQVINPFVKSDIEEEALITIINDTYKNFDHPDIAPLKNIEKNKYILELFYGPTLAFKDYALQFLGNLFSYSLKRTNNQITVIGATSGDTGSAAIDAFKGKKDIQVFILHPHKKISEVQRRQMTTITDENIHNIAVRGTFDDCQKILKQLFIDNELQSKTSLTAVNSINFSRLIAQTVYYFWAYTQLNENRVNFIVPSGNFGNIFSARIAKYMGLPIDCLHIVTNANDILHRTITLGEMKINEVMQTHSPSMDIQVSSNFERQLFESSKRNSEILINTMESFNKTGQKKLSNDIIHDLQSNYKTHSISNSQTIKTIREFNEKFNYLADPHTATGLSVLNSLNDDNPIVSLACAHPAKFNDAIKLAINKEQIFPEKIKKIFDQKENMTILDNDIDLIKSYINKFI